MARPRRPSPPDERPPDWRSLVPIYAAVAMFSTGEASLHVLVSPYLDLELGQGTAVIGTVLAGFGLASLLARLPVGAVYRTDRARRLLVVGGALSTLAFLAVPLVDGPVAFGGLMALDGLGWALATTTQLALLVASRPAGMSTAAAMAWYSGSQGIGNTLGGVSGGWLADTFGFDVAFVGLAMVPALATVLIVGTARRAGEMAGTPELAPRRRARGALRAAIRGMPPVVWAGVIIMLYINFTSALLNAFHPVLVLAAGLSLTQVGTLSTCRSLASSVVRLGAGPVLSRGGSVSRLTVWLATGSAGAVMLIPSVAGSFLLQVPLFLMTGLARGLLRITGSAEAFDGVEDDERSHGLVSALINIGLDAGKVAGPVVAGGVAQVIGLTATFRVVPIVLLLAYLGFEALARRRTARDRELVA